ncbi:MAG: peptide chain release factor N(5)-glutamine methyltransferase [Lachnospiraceae bacterium]|nr:peptide chain release factor N(5)-glutamine methyltransferase [Lachnospiraceae bacterium]
MTLFQLLTEGVQTLQEVGNSEAEQDARQLLLAAFHLDMVHFLLNRLQELEENEDNTAYTASYREMLAKRKQRIPLQQILGCQDFMGMTFYVNEHVLIPRQDTETLVELVLEEQRDSSKRVLDLCTGSGCIAVSLAAKGAYAQVTATDISEEALRVARRNAERHGCAIRFVQGDLLEALSGEAVQYDIITSNPPYIPTSVIRTLEPEVREHEPMLALDGTEDGLYFYRRIAAGAGHCLKPGGTIYLEIGYDQGIAVSGFLKEAGFEQVQVHKDLPGKDRVIRGTWPGKR